MSYIILIRNPKTREVSALEAKGSYDGTIAEFATAAEALEAGNKSWLVCAWQGILVEIDLP